MEVDLMLELVKNPELVYLRAFEMTLEVDQVFEIYKGHKRGEVTASCR